MGRGSALALAAEGCNLVLNARGGDALRRTADECRQRGVEVLEIVADATETDVPDALVATAIEAFGRLDIAVANSGGPPPGQSLAVSDDQIRAAVEANLLSSVRLARGSIAAMTPNGFGRVVCISSVSVKHPISGLSLSNTARVGLYAWCKTAAADLAADGSTAGITINLACPGLHETDRVTQLYGDGPRPRLGDAEDFGRVVAFLCSTSAAFITGQAVLVEGGANLRSVATRRARRGCRTRSPGTP